ncbi:GDSL-type esterase/lipase family protein [Flavobacterium sp. 7A]|uniref:GDSL-type esterase/lipase family protein n=1 Tax=Flavobacterium sp. 7A TaxID=2940571 RepID=UPI002225CA80|nr:GDSL-type esterase/lipase family protein [Flavobacterium sp. 7A]MCW2118454.1 hypothetical protein [Flavobacterium sp. 7A]
MVKGKKFRKLVVNYELNTKLHQAMTILNNCNQKIIRLTAILLLSSTFATFAQENIKIDNDKKYISFLTNAIENNNVNKESRALFLKESRTYWHSQKLDYNLHPENYAKTISLYHQNQLKFKQNNEQIDSVRKIRINIAVENFQNFDDRNSFPKKSVLFIGSSSIAGWKTSLSFPEFPIINRGVGGMNMLEIIENYDLLVKKYAPSVIVIYCDIDIEQGKSPKEAVDVFTALVHKIKYDFPKTIVLLLSMKPVMIDDFIGKDIRKNKMAANEQLLKFSKKEKNVEFIDLSSPMLHQDGKLKTAIFIEDGMHLNALGYSIWNPIIRKKIAVLMK